MRTIAALIRNVSLVRKVWLENVVRVAFNTMEEVIVGDAEAVGDEWHTVTAETEPFTATQQRIDSCSIRSRTHA